MIVVLHTSMGETLCRWGDSRKRTKEVKINSKH